MVDGGQRLAAARRIGDGEVQFFERGEFFGGRGAFPTKKLAIQFAEEERKAFERHQL